MQTGLNEQTFEVLISGLIDREFGVCDSFLGEKIIEGLRENLLNYHQADLMHPAGIGRNFDYIKNAKVRGDVIHWIDNQSQDPFERVFLDTVNAFIAYLNRTCYTGITDYEFHYAYYEEGSFYKRHLDQFKSNKGRQFSFVLYLNKDWQESSGGNLSLYLGEEEYTLYPIGDRVVFFRSDQTEHEVHPAHDRPRLSIAGWLKK